MVSGFTSSTACCHRGTSRARTTRSHARATRRSSCLPDEGDTARLRRTVPFSDVARNVLERFCPEAGLIFGAHLLRQALEARCSQGAWAGSRQEVRQLRLQARASEPSGGPRRATDGRRFPSGASRPRTATCAGHDVQRSALSPLSRPPFPDLCRTIQWTLQAGRLTKP